MKTTGVSQASKKNPDSCRALWKMSLLLLLVMPLFLMATEAVAAQITFEPNELTATVAPGKVVTVPVGVSFTDTAAGSYASFSVTSVDGTLDPAWINSQFYVSLDSLNNTNSQLLFQVNVPADAKVGKYKRVFRTLWVRSNEQVTPADLLINVEVSETLACQLPTISDISSAEETINVREHKEVTVDLSGVVTVQDGCDIFNAWYQLIDEYGELDRTEDLIIDDAGAFSVAVPMVASRKGKDKDGRLYTVKFMAENEAGVRESPETTILVLHDNHKKGKHKEKHKKEKHDSKKRDS